MTKQIPHDSGDDTLLLHAAASTGVDESKTDLGSGALSPGLRSTAPSPKIGTVLQGRFQLTELIGEGGMSRVYRALDLRRVEARSQNPFLAVKVLTVPFDDHVDSLQFLEREAHKLQSLTHPNIVRVIVFDRDQRTVFMTMELLSGESLQNKLRHTAGQAGGMPRDQVRAVVAGIVSALEFAHRHGIVHGDLKPGNVFITDGGEIKVIDFGIARFLGRPRDDDSPTSQRNRTHVTALTPPYAGPEMIEGMEPDPRDDIYALACIAHEMLTGEHPFARASSIEARATGAKVARHPAVTRAQYQAIVGGLRFDRGARTASAEAFLDEFFGPRSKTKRRWFAVGALAIVAAVGIAVYLNRTSVSPVTTQPTSGLSPGQVFRDCATCPLMRVLAPGTFVQGSVAADSEQPLHEVTIPAAIAFASREVTIGEFEEFAHHSQLQAQGCNVYDGEWRWRSDASWITHDNADTAQHPVSCVSWDEAAAYASWLSQKTGQIYRLPSASEWEYAARAGAATSLTLGADPGSACKLANIADETAAQRYPGWNVLACNDRYVQSAPVGAFLANDFGLHDMFGNVFEWVQDCWRDSYQEAPTNGAARSDGDCTSRELRGGSWFTSPDYLRASYRNQFERGYRSSSVGFRVVREIRP